jgi:hypothetical protein
MTRENSPDEAETNDPAHPRAADQAIVDAPMASLFEVTKLRNIRSDPASHRAAAARRPREPDFIDDGRVPLQDAEQLFARFRGTLNAYLWGGIALTHDTLASARESSPLLAAAVLAVTALHAEDGGHAFDACYPIFLELAGQSMFQRYHTLDDVRGLCIGAFWLSDVSWKLSGLAVRIATELNLHRSAARALRDGAQDVDEARLWYLLYVCDHHFSIAYGRPPVIPEDATIARHEAFLQLPGTGQADMRLHSQVAIFVILSRVYHTFGPDRSRLVANDEFESIRRYDADLFAWKRTWEPRLGLCFFILPCTWVILTFSSTRPQHRALSRQRRSPALLLCAAAAHGRVFARAEPFGAVPRVSRKARLYRHSHRERISSASPDPRRPRHAACRRRGAVVPAHHHCIRSHLPNEGAIRMAGCRIPHRSR